MQFKFLHTADIHLGYQQYGLSERYDDFTEAFRWIVDTALDERVDFLLIAGDLFEKRTLDPRTLLIAVTEFERLKAAGIPVVAIEGNHERTYGEILSWMEYLNQSRLLYLLDCSRHEQGWMPQPWDDAERTGGYVDIAGARIYGLKYQGAETGRALNEIGAAIAAAPPPDGVFSIFLAHTSVEGYYDKGHPFARQQDLSTLRQCIDYLALGHVHVPYRGTLGDGEWLFNPGCPESWSSEEWQYGNKGALLVKVDTSRTPAFCADPLNYPYRRPFVRIVQELDACPSPSTLLELLEKKVQREPVPNTLTETPQRAATTHSAHGIASQLQKSPVVDIVLTGVARFSRTEINTEAIEQLARNYLNPLVVRLRSSLQEALANTIEDGDMHDRDVLERLVLETLIAADDRFASTAADTTQIAMALKQMVLDGVTSGEIAEEVGRRLRSQRQASGTDAESAPATVESGQSASEDRSADARAAEFMSASIGESHANDERLRHYVQQDNLFGSSPASKETPKTTD